MVGAGKSRLRFFAQEKFMASVLCLLLLLTILLVLSINEPVHTRIIDSPTNFTMDNHNMNGMRTIWINITKTTGGWPLFKNDIYNAMGLELLIENGNQSGFYGAQPYVYAEGKWRIQFVMTSIASSRVKNIDKESYSIKSQRLTVIFPKVKTNNLSLDIAGIQGIESDAFESWPCTYPAHRTWSLNGSALYPSVINEMDKYTRFSLSPNEFDQSQGSGSWHWGENIVYMNNHPEITERVVFPYSQSLGGNLSDCGYTYHINDRMPPGVTQEFDIITETNWGLFETSQVSLHVKITAPPDPIGMSKSELEKYGIKPQYNIFGDIYQYYVDPGNISIEVT